MNQSCPGRPWQPVFCASLAIGLTSLWFFVSTSSVIVRAERALGRRDYGKALILAGEALQRTPKSDRALIIAGEASLAINNASAAKRYLKQVSSSDPLLFARACRELGRLEIHSYHPAEAEALLQQSLRANPSDAFTHDQLIYLLTLQGRLLEARALAQKQIASGVITLNYLILVERRDPSLEMSVNYAKRCLAEAPQESLPRLALAQEAWQDNRQADVAQGHLDAVLKTHPDLLDAHLLRCAIASESGESREFSRVSGLVPDSLAGHAAIWLARGVWTETAGQTAAAARCFWEAVRLEPNDSEANYRLAQALTKLKRTDEAQQFAERARQLSALSLDILSLQENRASEKLLSIVAELQSMGREWEAAGWCRVVFLETGRHPGLTRQTELRLHRSLLAGESTAAAWLDPTRRIDLSGYPLPDLSALSTPALSASRAEVATASVHFDDEAIDVGLDFTYQNGASRDDLESILEMDGGGIAVLDYDGDHWPDVYFTQGGNLPPALFDSRQSDRLFRNHGDDSARTPGRTQFENVADAAGMHDIGYGQGVTVGDFDGDGFSDLYVGNVGSNQFYRNNGDGTFSDVTAQTQTQAGGWTSSCVLADFNLDGLPDLYVVTYLEGKEPFVRRSKRVRQRWGPLDYPAEPDRFYLNLGDGRFQDLSEQFGLLAPNGRGLGLVAADFDGSHRLSLFVANDMSSNFFFINRTTAPDKIQFDEQALSTGLALDHLGQSKACMGIAVADFSGHGKLDMVVTNFYRQSNDFYVQQPDGSFRDASREAGLFEPSFLQLGWGTQALDADLDGRPDLLVANGHVHDPIDPQIPYQMTPQFFRNRGDGTFGEIPGPQLGEFFLKKQLGRSLARLDWNRDGREDACISHLDSPAALLTNRTNPAGHFLALRLAGVESPRDAIGAHVRVTANGRTQYQQLTAGDGFQSANQRLLVFGLGAETVVDAVEILWPSGRHQQIAPLQGDHEWIVVEGRSPVEIR